MGENTVLLKNAVIPKQNGERGGYDLADVFIRAQRIAAIENAGTIPDDRANEVVDASRLLLLPGMINGHVHSWDHFLKGQLENLTTELFMAQIRPRTPVKLTDRQIYLRTMIGAIESLKTGATTIIDDMSLGQAFARSTVDAAMQAYSDTGTRALVGFSMIDKPVVDSYPFVDEIFPAELLAELRALPRPTGHDLLDLCRDLAKTNHPSSNRIGVIVAPSAAQRCTDDFLKACRSLADELDLPAMIHCQETRIQIVTAQEFYGTSIVQHLKDIGFLAPRTALIHATWLSKSDIEIIAESGASVQYNPWSNMITGAGIAPVRECLEAGINMGMGSDGTGILFGVNMLNSVGSGAALHKVYETDYRRWLSAQEVFDAATIGGARALGMEHELGRLRVGYKADLVGYSLDAPSLTPLNNPVPQVVYGERGAGVDTVLVDGRIVVQGGKCTLIDEVALLREAQDAHAELKDQITSSLGDSKPFLDALSSVYFKSLECPLCHDYHPAVVKGNNIAGGVS